MKHEELKYEQRTKKCVRKPIFIDAAGMTAGTNLPWNHESKEEEICHVRQEPQSAEIPCGY